MMAGFEPSEKRQVDHRRAARQKTVLLVCRLIAPTDDHLCLIRDISEFGAKAQTAQKLRIGDPITFEFGNRYRLKGTVRWARDKFVGVEFDKTAELSPLLRDKRWSAPGRQISFSASATDTRRVCPRVRRKARVALYRQGKKHLAELYDVSTSGAGINLHRDASHNLQVGDWLVCEIAGVGEQTATVRWIDAHRLGLSFDRPLPLKTLDDWFTSAQNRG